MKRLMRNEEIQILKELMKEEDNFLDNGSSRAVFNYDNNFCVKIAVDQEGQFQNQTEIKLYDEYGSEFLAKIKSYGEYIVVMEKVRAYHRHVVRDAIYRYEHKDEERSPFFTEEEVKKLLVVKNNLDDILTEADDNFQLGKAKDGRMVSYDYGYLPYEHEKSVSNSLYQTLNSFDTIQDFLKYMVSKLPETL